MMINVKQIFNEIPLHESNSYGRCRHIFEDGDITFADIRDILTKVFSGELEMHEKIDGAAIFITYKDGEFQAAVDLKTLSKPLDYDRITAKYCDAPPEIKDAFQNSMKDLAAALESIDEVALNRFFANGQNFLNCEIVYPPCENVVDYGNRCFIVLNSVKCFDSGFNEIGEDRKSADELFELLRRHNALKQEMFEIAKPAALRLKNTVSAKETLDGILAKLEKFIDGVGWKCSLNKYILDRYSRHIVNKALKYGIDVSRDSDFVDYLSSRLSQVSGKKPTKSDLATYAKRDGIKFRTDEYRTFIDDLEQNCDKTNAEIIKPIEDFIIGAGIALMKNIAGFMSVDPSKAAKRASSKLDQTILDIKEGEYELSPEKIRKFKQNLACLNKYAEQIPAGGVVIKYKGRAYKLTGQFGAANEILNIIKYK